MGVLPCTAQLVPVGGALSCAKLSNALSNAVRRAVVVDFLHDKNSRIRDSVASPRGHTSAQHHPLFIIGKCAHTLLPKTPVTNCPASLVGAYPKLMGQGEIGEGQDRQRMSAYDRLIKDPLNERCDRAAVCARLY